MGAGLDQSAACDVPCICALWGVIWGKSGGPKTRGSSNCFKLCTFVQIHTYEHTHVRVHTYTAFLNAIWFLMKDIEVGCWGHPLSQECSLVLNFINMTLGSSQVMAAFQSWSHGLLLHSNPGISHLCFGLDPSNRNHTERRSSTYTRYARSSYCYSSAGRTWC